MLRHFTSTLSLLFIFAIYSGPAAAAAPMLKVTKSVEINAPADEVWDEVNDFDDLDEWHPAVANDEVIQGDDNEVGSVRILTLADGGTIKEKLLAYDDAGMSFTYKIIKGVLPVSNYKSTVMVKPTGDASSKATWTGQFQRKDLSDNPAKGEDDKVATDTISSVYQGGLDNLKKIAESED